MLLQSPGCYQFGRFRLDPAQHQLFEDGHPVSLTPKAFDALRVLVENHGRLVSKEELLQTWVKVRRIDSLSSTEKIDHLTSQPYQGLKLSVVYPSSGNMLVNQFSDGSRSVVQNSSEVSNYFDVQFVSVESQCSRGTYVAADGKCEWDSPTGAGCYAIYNETTQKCMFSPSPSSDTILLEPAFPIFQEGWAQKVGMTIKVKPGTPKGKYLIGVGVSSPDKDIRDEWLLEYKLLYAGSTMFGSDVPWFNVFVQVN